MFKLSQLSARHQWGVAQPNSSLRLARARGGSVVALVSVSLRAGANGPCRCRLSRAAGRRERGRPSRASQSQPPSGRRGRPPPGGSSRTPARGPEAQREQTISRPAEGPSPVADHRLRPPLGHQRQRGATSPSGPAASVLPGEPEEAPHRPERRHCSVAQAQRRGEDSGARDSHREPPAASRQGPPAPEKTSRHIQCC